MILFGLIMGVSSVFYSSDSAETDVSNGVDDSYQFEEYNEPGVDYKSLTACEPNQLMSEGTGMAQSICLWDDSEQLRLNTVIRSDTQTELNLSLVGTGDGFCTWSLGHAYGFKLVDQETGQDYPLVNQITEIKLCDLAEGDERFTYLDYGTEMPLKLVFGPLPISAKKLTLIESVEEGSDMNPTKIRDIQLLPLK